MAGETVLARVLSAAIQGVEALPIAVEVDLAGGLPALHMVGLPDAAIRESRDRVRSAIQNSGFSFPARRITVNLAPAHVRKEGTALDLPLAVGILIGAGVLPPDCAQGLLLAGELSLDGGIRGVKGALSFALTARKLRCRGLVVPATAAAEASAVDGVDVFPFADLLQVVSFLRGDARPDPLPVLTYDPGAGDGCPGEASLAHNGVLFLDELPEFRRGALEVLRQPMEEGRIAITRSMQVLVFPARFILIAAMNP